MLSKQLDEYFIQKALSVAKKGYLKGEIPVGALAVNLDNEIICTAHNECECSNNPINHAEMILLNKLSKNNIDKSNLTIYVTLEPCLMCASAIMLSRIKRLVFGAYNKLIGGFGTTYDLSIEPNFQHNILITGGILKNECNHLIDNFFKNIRRRDGT